MLMDVARAGMYGAQVELPEDPNLKGFIGSKPEFVSRKSGSRRASVDAEEKKEEIMDAGMAPPPTDNIGATSDAGTPRSERTLCATLMLSSLDSASRVLSRMPRPVCALFFGMRLHIWGFRHFQLLR